MSKIERKSLDGTATLEGLTFQFDAVVFRRASYGAFGRIGATPWQFGTFSQLRVSPSVPDRLMGDLMAEIARRANQEE